MALEEITPTTFIGDAIRQSSNVLPDEVLDFSRDINLIPVAALDRVHTVSELEPAFLFAFEQHGAKDETSCHSCLDKGVTVRRRFTKSAVITLFKVGL